MVCDILKQHHQPDPADDTARDGEARSLFAASEHGDKEQGAKSDYDEGPEKSPVQIAKDLSCQGQETEGNQDRPSDQ